MASVDSAVLRVRPATRPDVSPGRGADRPVGPRPDEGRGAAAAAGFRTLTLVATLPGEPLYQALGFTVTERFQLRLPDEVEIAVARMSREVT